MTGSDEEHEISDFVTKFSGALRRSKRIPPAYRARLRKLQAMDSILRVRKMNQGTITSNDYRDVLLATIADPSLPKGVREGMKDLAVQILSPDDEGVEHRDKEMEALLGRILSGSLDYHTLSEMYLNGSLERAMRYLEKLLERAGDEAGGYDEKLLEILGKHVTRGYPGRRFWGPDKLIQFDFLYKNFAEFFGKNLLPHDALRRRVLNTLSSLGRSLEKRKSGTHGTQESTVKRPYSLGDDIDAVDFEDTIENILEGVQRPPVEGGTREADIVGTDKSGIGSGNLVLLRPEDIVVKEEIDETITAVFLQDVSYSMFDYLSTVIPCFILTYSAFKDSRRGICLFSGNAYPVKSVLDDLDDEKAIGAYYNLISAGLSSTLERGTMGMATFRWAEQELEKVGGGRKIVFLFSDCGFNEYGNPLDIVTRLNERGAEVIIVHPDIERGFFGWGPYGGPNLVGSFKKGGCKVLDCSVFDGFVTQLEEIL